ncbi:hypothetical protein LPTSP4_36480 [Leptospira ryugenii]|uniref:Uncharacterized protein n=1 Tax=Leptospira ryugenii TaxID=1917863 RepID=A0A2P2E5F4_9LEPT|nr:hypothetical protein [Leptospira ryugenii]GBF52110.1 hypothetical protein LPTSP4_36480 [Leptospira ryugenii]
MIKKYIILSIILTLNPSLLNSENLIESLKKQILTKGDGFWGPGGESSSWGWGFEFYDNGKMTMIFVGEGGEEIKGTYSIRNNKLYVKSDKDYECNLINLEDNLIFKLALNCSNGLRLYGYAHKSINETRKIDNNTVITMGRKRFKITENVKFRVAPELNSETIKCKFLSLQHTEIDFLPRSTVVHVLARTEDKIKIKNWNNYWYYVTVMYDMHDGESCQKDYGWIYAQFTELDSYQDI